MRKKLLIVLVCIALCLVTACSGETQTEESGAASEASQEGMQLISGGSFTMGSPDSESWRGEDEVSHQVTLSDFYLGTQEVTQGEYERIMRENPSQFSGENRPVESVSWIEAAAYCNALSEAENLTPAYTIEGENVSWDRSADGYRLPTEAEWEYACRAGTTTPFNTETSISTDEANYWGDYPYEIEDNYFEQEKLDTQPGIYREETVETGSFAPNKWGLYEMHGNVGEWVWDLYGAYDQEAVENPTGVKEGTLRVYRGGGWNDFAKNLRSAYRAALQPEKTSASIGFRVARNAGEQEGEVIRSGESADQTKQGNGNMLIAYFSWSGNTRGVAEEIAGQTGAEIFEIQMTEPYSDDYNTVLDQAQRDQKRQARPQLSTHVENMDQYDTIFLGYPNWWASIPMPVASFLEEYDFNGKTILPFCSHGGGRFGQSLTAISKLAPSAVMGEGLAVSYSGGSDLPDHVADWLKENNVESR